MRPPTVLAPSGPTDRSDGAESRLDYVVADCRLAALVREVRAMDHLPVSPRCPICCRLGDSLGDERVVVRLTFPWFPKRNP